MTTFTKEQLISHARESVSYLEDLKGRASKEGEDCKVVLEMVERELELARIALASLEAEPVAWAHRLINKRNGVVHPWVYGSAEACPSEGDIFNIEVMPLYTAPTAQVVPENYVTAEHRRVIEMLLNVCGAAFELADDSCQQDVDGEECHVVPDDAFQKLSDALDEIENTLPTEDVDRPDVFLAWSAMPRAALKSILQAGNSPVTPDGWISCSERMPNDKQYVWCWGKSYGWTECDTFEGYYDWSRNKWWAVTDYGEEPASKVTHWMPLPEPPEQDGE